MRHLIKGLVFDFDGLILDTETVTYQSLQWLYSQYGQSLSLEIWGECIGTDHDFDPVVYLKEIAELETSEEELRRAYLERFHELIAQEGPLPGVVDYLKGAKAMGLGLAVASSSPSDWVHGFLKEKGLLEWFDAICTADDVEIVKPDPALYRLAVQRLGIAPHEAVAFEDSPNGALAAVRAGLYCVVIPNSVTQNLAFGEYDLKLTAMSDLPLEQLIETVVKERHREIS